MGSVIENIEKTKLFFKFEVKGTANITCSLFLKFEKFFKVKEEIYLKNLYTVKFALCTKLCFNKIQYHLRADSFVTLF